MNLNIDVFILTNGLQKKPDVRQKQSRARIKIKAFNIELKYIINNLVVMSIDLGILYLFADYVLRIFYLKLPFVCELIVSPQFSHFLNKK